MSFVIYNKATTKTFSVPATSANCWKDSWKSKGAATRAFNKAVSDEKITADEYAIADHIEFHNNIEKMHTVKNQMTGKDVQERVNTPYGCSVQSDNYWQS